MIRRIWMLYTVELVKALRQKQTYLGPVLVVLVVLAAVLLRPFSRDGVSDYAFLAYATPIALNSIGFLMLLVFCAGLVSAETGSGTIRQLLVRPVLRQELVLAKMLTGMTYALSLVLLVSSSAWGLARVFGDLAGVAFGGELVYTREEMALTYLSALGFSMAPLFAGASFAVMVSSLTRSPLAAVSISAGAWIAVDLLKHLPEALLAALGRQFPGRVADWLATHPVRFDYFIFTSHLDYPWQVYASRCDALDAAWFPAMGYALGSTALTIVACTTVAMAAIRRRNFSAW